MKNSFLLPICSSLLLLNLGHAQINVTTQDTPLVLNFDSTVAGAYRFAGNPLASGTVISEPNGWAAQGEENRFVFYTASWHYFGDSRKDMTNAFTNDANNDGNQETRFDFFQAGVIASPSGTPGDYAFRFLEDTWADKVFSFKVTNNTGSTVTNWNVSLDSWFNDTGKGPATLGLYYSDTWTLPVNNNEPAVSAGFTNLAARSGTNTSSGLSTKQTLGGDFSLSIPQGGSLFVQLFYDQNGQGTEFIVDNIAVTAVPEPVTISSLAALVRRK